MKSALKRFYYRLRPCVLPDRQYVFVFVFHVEQIYDATLFERLLAFCKHYFEVTGATPVCTLMSGANARVREGLIRFAVSAETLACRMRTLAQVATLGYHGHFWIDPDEPNRYEGEIRCNNFIKESVRQQLEADIRWFTRHEVPIQSVYSAGWWFVNAFLLQELARNGFDCDFSFSFSPWFRNQYSYKLLTSTSIAAGEPFRCRLPQRDILCVQTFIGCSGPEFLDDVCRGLCQILRGSPARVIGALCSHDYDLRPGASLRCIAQLAKMANVKFVGYHDVISWIANSELTTVSIVEPDEDILTG